MEIKKNKKEIDPDHPHRVFTRKSAMEDVIVKQRLIGQGTYGTVYMPVYRDGGLLLAAKSWGFGFSFWASYNSLNLPEYLLTHGPKSVANEFQSEKDVKGEDVEDIHVSINQVQVTDESAEYLKSGSAVFSVLRNLGKSEEGEAVRYL
ncbi:hypothetical protein CK203_045969 [Vitis vinifera]|uniref:Uncharacterized protein n=1 Tax=Vitis vinifera TaxID=29760 RepID=A0A438HGZ3_VITVI|nr:hypothetical protein CK203_045969 [Vitis vinifera]